MLPALAMLVILATSGSAFANPPASPLAPESRSSTTPNSSGENSTSENSAAHSVPATAAPAAKTSAAPASPTPQTSGEQLAERQLRMEGYKLRMVNGVQKYCRRETPLGSHLASVMHCVTVAEAEEMVREARETTEHIQRNTPGCLSSAVGRCGN